MLYFLFFLLVAIGILFHRSKAVRWLLIIYIGIIMGLNSYNPDYTSYFLIYQDPQTAQEEVGFRFLCSVGSNLGLSYDQFHFVIVIISLYIMIRGVTKLQKHESWRTNNFFLSSYLLFPLMFDVVLLRSFISGCIIIYSLHFLCENKTIKYIVGVLIAATIHLSSLFFLLLLLSQKVEAERLNDLAIFPFLKKIREKKERRKVVLFSVLVLTGLVVLLRLNIVQTILLRAGANAIKVQLWLTGKNITTKKIILVVSLHLVNFIVYRIIHRDFRKGRNSKSILAIDGVVYAANYYVLFINSLFTVYADQFLRILGVGVVINSIYYSILLNLEHRQLKRWEYLILGTIPAAMLFVFRMFEYQTPMGESYFSYVFKCIIDNNFLVLS